jgi:plastocyanin
MEDGARGATRPTSSKSSKTLLLFLFAALVVFLTPVTRAAEWTVGIYDFYFLPTNLTVSVGDTVTWVNLVPRAHDTTYYDPNNPEVSLWASDLLGLNERFSYTFANAGSFPYVCAVHYFSRPWQTGLVVAVQANLPPSVNITNPANGAFFTPPASFTLSANATDSDGSVISVEFFLNANSIGVSTGPIFSTNLSGLGVGNYAFTARATDNQGATTLSDAVAVTVQESVPTNFTLTVSRSPTNGGTVTVTPPAGANGVYLAGTPIALSAQPNPGFQFTDWSGSVNSTNNPLVLVMNNDQAVTANFVVIPPIDFGVAGGSFAGLLFDSVEQELSALFPTGGFLSLRISERGSYRGIARIGGIRENFSGQFDRLGYAPFVLRRGTLSGSLQLDAMGARVTGFITDDVKSPTLLLYRNAAATNLAVPAGNYTVMMAVAPPMSDAGLMTMHVSTDGDVRMRGELGDGTPMRLQSFVSAGGRIPLYTPLYHHRGALFGWLDVLPNGTGQGTMYWVRPPDSRNNDFPDGFAVTVPMNGIAESTQLRRRTRFSFLKNDALCSPRSLTQPAPAK